MASGPPRRAFTLVEMLVAMSLTLLMMAAVVGVFASVSGSIADRRAGIEMSSSLRHARSVLQDDLQNATCPAIPWTRPEANQGYLEIVEGPQSDFDPSIWLSDENGDGLPDSFGGLQIDLAVSQLPSSNLYRLPGSTEDVRNPSSPPAGFTPAVTDGGGLGDWDDVLMLTARNESKPFIGRVPAGYKDTSNNQQLAFEQWGATEIESDVAEVIWFAVENPVEDTRSFYFGEPGFRTVYRRALLVAPWLNFAFRVGGIDTGPGVVRVLPNSVDQTEADQAAAALIAFQEQYDLSVRLEWDPLLDGGRWVIKANTLGDLTKRENRMEHLGVTSDGSGGLVRWFPYRSVFSGGNISGTLPIAVQPGVDYKSFRSVDTVVASPTPATGRIVAPSGGRNHASLYEVTTGTNIRNSYGNRPFTTINSPSIIPPTVRAIIDENGQVVMFTNGMVPLGGNRRGEDVMLTNMLAFDLKVYDPEAPLLAEISNTNSSDYPGEVVDPGSPAWGAIVVRDFANNVNPQAIVGRGAYVDLGYAGLHAYFAERNDGVPKWPDSVSTNQSTLMGNSILGLGMVGKSALDNNPIKFPSSQVFAFQPYRTYDTWSTSYENNGLDDDDDGVVDQGSDGFDSNNTLGVDDTTERETAPPYDTALRGIQVTLRGYELDSRQIREVNVKQTFVPK